MSDIVEFRCPHCQENIRTNARYAGMQGQCPHCNKTVTVKAPSDVGNVLMVAPSPTPASSTEANTLLAGLIGTIATLLLYAVFFAVRDTYVGQLFTHRGPVPFITTLFTCCGLAILVLKYLAVNRELKFAERELDFIPLGTGVQITPKNVDQFLHHLESLPERARASLLGRRIYGVLEHFRSRNSVPEVQAYLSSHAEIDASKVDAGYTLLRAFIWAVPILGFIGTVTGISSAVTGLAGSLETSQEQVAAADSAATAEPEQGADMGSKLIQAMGLVTQGLATAFDTTFVAPVFAIGLLFPAESLKRIEYGMLDRIEAFMNESLLRRMSDKENDRLLPELARLLEPVFCKHQQWLVEWQTQVANLGNIIGRDLESHAARIQKQLEQAQNREAQAVTEQAQSLTAVIREMNQSIGQLQLVSRAVTDNLQAALRTAAERTRPSPTTLPTWKAWRHGGEKSSPPRRSTRVTATWRAP